MRDLASIASDIQEVRWALRLIPEILDKREANIREGPDLSAVQRRQAIAEVRIELRTEQECYFQQLERLLTEAHQAANQIREAQHV